MFGNDSLDFIEIITAVGNKVVANEIIVVRGKRVISTVSGVVSLLQVTSEG